MHFYEALSNNIFIVYIRQQTKLLLHVEYLTILLPLGEVLTWNEENTYCSEPVFIQTPGKPENTYCTESVSIQTPGKLENTFCSEAVSIKPLGNLENTYHSESVFTKTLGELENTYC